MEKKNITLEDLKESQNPALKRVAKKVEEEMGSSAYTSHNSHYSSSNSKKASAAEEKTKDEK